MINPDFYMTLYISEEVIRWVALTTGFVVTTWGVVKMTDILFGKRNQQHKQESSNEA